MKMPMSSGFRWAVSLLSSLVVLAGCGRSGGEEGAAVPDAVRLALGNATYPSQFVREGNVTLTDGVYEEAPEPGAASHVQVMLGEVFAFGAIGNSPRAAAVVLYTTTGGSGTFVDLAVVPFEGDTPGRAVVTFLGDRVKIEALGLEDGQVTVDLLAHGSGDPMCCPTEKRDVHYAWVEDKLERLGPPADTY